MKLAIAIAQFCCASLVWQALTPLVSAQISGAADGTNTLVNQAGSTFTINGGTQTGTNIFHSFQQFGLNQGQIATFLSNPAIQNILGRVTGGSPSVIHGQIQVTGSNANLFLMNPAGILFGANASLNVPGSFTATTANAIGFRPEPGGTSASWFNAVGTNDYASLVGPPTSFVFSMPQPGAIANLGTLAVGQGQALTLLGGTVVNNGTLSAPGGTVTVASVPGEQYVRLGQTGNVLSFDLPATISNQVNPLPFTPVTLPELLTGGGGSNATGIVVENGVVKLTGSGLSVNPGDVVAKAVTAETAHVSAANNLTLVESQLQTTGDLNLQANRTVLVRDSVTHPVLIQAGKNLTVQGTQGIDALALNHPTPAFQSGGDLSLISNGLISGDAHYASRNFSIRKLDGTPGTFVSLYDPIISANGDVTFGDYTGVSLKVEATGNITAGNIQITGTDGAFAGAPVGSDRRLLSDFRTVILRAGVPVLQETTVASNPSPNPPFSVGGGGTSFNGTAPTAITGRVTVGNPADPSVLSIDANYVDISAPNGILINTPVRANYVKLTANSGNVIVHSVLAEFASDTLPGDIDITAGGLFQATGTLDAIGFDGYATGLKNYVLVDPNLVPFLVNKTGDTQANVETAIQNSNPADGTQKMYVESPISISSVIGTINIQYGGGGPTTTLSPGVTVQGGNTPFVIGPTVTPGAGDPYLPTDPASDYGTFVADPFSLTRNETYSLAILPPGSSGTVGAIIRTVVIDGSLTVAVQNRVLGATLPLPVQPTDPTNPIAAPSTTPSTPEVSTVEPPGRTIAQQSVQRNFVNQTQNGVCENSPSAIAATTNRTRSGTAVTNPCKQVGDDEQILKILGEDSGPGKPQ